MTRGIEMPGIESYLQIFSGQQCHFADEIPSPLPTLPKEVVFLHASGKESQKFQALRNSLATEFPPVEKPRLVISWENEAFEEDAARRETERKLGLRLVDPVVIALLKADRRLSTIEGERSAQILQLLKAAKISDLNEVPGPVLTVANDVMVKIRGEGIALELTKPKLSLTGNDQADRMKVFAYLESFFRSLPKLFHYQLTSATAIAELTTNQGMVFLNTMNIDARRPDVPDLEALAFGYSPGMKGRRVEELEEVNRFAPLGSWTPDKGFDLAKIVNVNGGLKLDHPLWRYICSYDDNGQQLSPEHFIDSAFLAHVESSQLIAGGYPLHLKEMLLTLFEKIAAEYFQVGPEHHQWQALGLPQQDLLNHLSTILPPPTAQWGVQLIDGHTSKPHYHQERIQQLFSLYQALARTA